MPVLRPCTRDYKTRDGKYRIFIYIYHKGIGYISTPYYLDNPDHLRNGQITDKHPNCTALNKALRAILISYEDKILRLGLDLRKMNINGLVAYLKNEGDNDFYRMSQIVISKCRKEGRISRARIYEATVKQLKEYTDKELNFDDFSQSFVDEFCDHLRKTCNVNTAIVYLDAIKTIFHTADKKVPFKVNLKPVPVLKKALDIEDIKKIKDNPGTELFMLLFYLQGINLKDLLYLRPSDYHKGRISFVRSKTKVPVSCKVYPVSESIIKSFRGEKYLLNFLDENDSYKHYVVVYTTINRELKKYGVTTYSARHSFATLCSQLGYPNEVIAQALGHKIRGMTETYISRNYDKQDKMLLRVINLL